MKQEEKDFIAAVKEISILNSGRTKNFILKHVDYHENSILTLRVPDYESAKDVFKQIFGANYNEENFERQEGFDNNKIVYIHLVIGKSQSS